MAYKLFWTLAEVTSNEKKALAFARVLRKTHKYVSLPQKSENGRMWAVYVGRENTVENPGITIKANSKGGAITVTNTHTNTDHNATRTSTSADGNKPLKNPNYRQNGANVAAKKWWQRSSLAKRKAALAYIGFARAVPLMKHRLGFDQIDLTIRGALIAAVSQHRIRPHGDMCFACNRPIIKNEAYTNRREGFIHIRCCDSGSLPPVKYANPLDSLGRPLYKATEIFVNNAPNVWAVMKRATPGAKRFNGEIVKLCKNEAEAVALAARLNAGEPTKNPGRARPFRCSCGGRIEAVKGEDDRFECDDCGQLYERDDWRSDRLKAVD